MNGSVSSLAFTHDGTKLFSHGGKLSKVCLEIFALYSETDKVGIWG